MAAQRGREHGGAEEKGGRAAAMRSYTGRRTTGVGESRRGCFPNRRHQGDCEMPFGGEATRAREAATIWGVGGDDDDLGGAGGDFQRLVHGRAGCRKREKK